jgi:hypothetical protein
MSLARTIEETKVAPGSVMCWWLGGAGFVFKTSSGTQVYLWCGPRLPAADSRRASPP